MNYKITALAVMISVVGLMTSCLSSDSDSTETYDDTLITTFTLGKVKCVRTIHKSNGTDSTYSYTYSASSYAMSIDQLNNKIFNIDSLVMGSKVDSVQTTIYTENDGIVAIQNLGFEDNDSISEWSLYDSDDYIDYTKDRLFRVWSSDGESYKDYTVSVNVHKEVADSFVWDVSTKDTLPAFRNVYSTLQYYSYLKQNLLYILFSGQQGVENSLYVSVDGTDWYQTDLPEGSSSSDSVIVAANKKLYTLVGNQLWQTDNPLAERGSWTKVSGAPALSTLCGGDSLRLYAIDTNNHFVCLKNGASSFVEDEIEDTTYNKVNRMMPFKDVNFISMPVNTNDNLDRFTIVANSNAKYGNDSTAVIWNKIYDADNTLPWTYTVFNGRNHYYTLPNMDGMTAVCYGDNIFAMGGKTNHRLYKDDAPFSKLYYSQDHGATWHTGSDISLPSSYDCSNVKCVDLLADGKTLYFVAIRDITVNGTNMSEVTVWRGHQNKANWSTTPYYFD